MAQQTYSAPSSPTNTAASVSAICAGIGWAALPTSLCVGLVPVIGLCAFPGLLAVPVLFVVAVVFGHRSLRQLRTSGEGGRVFAVAGLVAGYVGLAVCILGLILLVLLVIFAANNPS